ncbi:Hypothetical_protein [Hexamita inflata]|uniref:Hypothetical_protein n=1 Tax=Hexamita inflata TaxID=28002 RepID=A0AA86RPC7_9EUKA|nr:Hypothetical protein HINF_LOCUS64838 [Hexamita inflata]
MGQSEHDVYYVEQMLFLSTLLKDDMFSMIECFKIKTTFNDSVQSKLVQLFLDRYFFAEAWDFTYLFVRSNDVNRLMTFVNSIEINNVALDIKKVERDDIK